MATLEDFLPDIQPHLPGCPEGVTLNAIRNSCIRFCTDTWLIRENLAAIDVVINVDEYTMTAASQSDNVIVGMVNILYDEKPLARVTEEELDIADVGWRTNTTTGVPNMVTSPKPDIILLNRIPEESITGGMIVRVATKPTSTTSTVDDLLLDDWTEGIKYGALQELYEIPGKGWSDMKQALWYGKRFNFEIQRGKARIRMGNMTKSTVARNRAWI